MKTLELDIGVKVRVSSNGDVYTLDKQNIRSNGRKDNRRGRKIKPMTDTYGYLRCTFSNNGKRQSEYVHRLVALAYIPNPENKPTVNHINGVKTDNRVENLEWATPREQKMHSIRTGLCDKNIAALRYSNERRKVAILYDGVIYPSLNHAKRVTGLHPSTIKKYGVIIKNDLL